MAESLLLLLLSSLFLFQKRLIAKEREFSELKAQHDDLLIILVDEVPIAKAYHYLFIFRAHVAQAHTPTLSTRAPRLRRSRLSTRFPFPLTYPIPFTLTERSEEQVPAAADGP